MTRRPPEAQGETSTLWAWLLEREEQAHRRPGRTLRWTPEQPSYTGTVERLEDLRAGEPVNIAASDLPRWARADRGEIHWWHRAIVRPDGGVQFVDDDGEWARENGL